MISCSVAEGTASSSVFAFPISVPREDREDASKARADADGLKTPPLPLLLSSIATVVVVVVVVVVAPAAAVGSPRLSAPRQRSMMGSASSSVSVAPVAAVAAAAVAAGVDAGVDAGIVGVVESIIFVDADGDDKEPVLLVLLDCDTASKSSTLTGFKERRPTGKSGSWLR